MPEFTKKIYTTENREAKLLFNKSSGTPVMSIFLGGNVILWKDANTNQIRFGRTMDGESFTEKEKLINESTAYGPSVLLNVLNWIWIPFTDELTKTVKLRRMRGALQLTDDILEIDPEVIETEYKADSEIAIEYYENQIYMAWKGTDKKIIIVRSENGLNWDRIWDGERTESGATLKRFNDKLLLGWRGEDDHLNIMESTNGLEFGNKKTLERKTTEMPWLETQDGNLYFAFRDKKDDRPAIIISNDGTKFNGQITFTGETCGSGGPSLEISQGKINMLWTTESQEIKLMKFRIKKIMPTDRISEI